MNEATTAYLWTNPDRDDRTDCRGRGTNRRGVTLDLTRALRMAGPNGHVSTLVESGTPIRDAVAIHKAIMQGGTHGAQNET